MKSSINTNSGSGAVHFLSGKAKPATAKEAYAELELAVKAALETYSNVHRGSGYKSIVTTRLYEQARDIVLEYLGLKRRSYRIVFCSKRRAEALKVQLEPGSFSRISSKDIGLPLGVTAMAVKRNAFPKGIPFEAGGGNSRLISRDWVVWAGIPDKFEAGTPAIINIIALAKALSIIRQLGYNPFEKITESELSVNEILHHDNIEGYTGLELLDQLRQTLIGRNISVPTLSGESRFINFDNAASTPTFAPVLESFYRAWRLPGKIQQEIAQEVRSICAGFLGASAQACDLIFTSNTTEAINIAARSLSHELIQNYEPVLLSSLAEHSSNDLPWRLVPGLKIVRMPVSTEGFFDPEVLESILRAYNLEYRFGSQRIKLVALSGASNALGIYNNLAEISRIVHKYGARFLVDAAQLIAHRSIEMEACQIDYLAFSAHKVYAPFGCGMLVVKKGLLNFTSAEMELIQSSGEENTAGIAALGKALVLLKRVNMEVIQADEQALTARTLHGMAKIDGLRIHGVQSATSPGFTQKGGVIVFDIKGIISASIAKELAFRGIGIRFGCHCAHILIKHILGVNPGLERFQRILVTVFPKLQLPGLARVSLGIGTSEEDIDILIETLDIIVSENRKTKSRLKTKRENKTSLISRAEVKKQINDFARAAAQRIYS